MWQVLAVYGVILGAVIDVRYLANVVLLLLLVVEGLEQLAPPVKHEQQPLTPTGHPSLQSDHKYSQYCEQNS